MSVVPRALRVAGALLFAACAATACAAGDRESANAGLRDVVGTGTLEDQGLSEASGLAPSALHDGLFWSFNDSGHDADLFALDSTGAALGRVKIAGAKNRDWEAIAVGPCDGGACVYIGDVGDNNERRRTVRLWRVTEPQPSEQRTREADSLPFSYSDGAHDVEAMWASPDTSVWLLTKRPQRDRQDALRPALLFRLPPSAWRERRGAVAELVDSLPITPGDDARGWITDAAFTLVDDGARVVVRTYRDVVVFDADPWSGRPGAELARCSLAALGETKGEAVAWLRGGRLLLGNEGRGSRLATGRCQP